MPHNLIADIALSEMSRNALNNWTKFALPQSERQIDDLLARLGATSGAKAGKDRSPGMLSTTSTGRSIWSSASRRTR